MDDTYCVAKASVFHFNQDFTRSNFIKNNILKNKRSSWFLNHECRGWYLFFWDHHGGGSIDMRQGSSYGVIDIY